MSVHEPEVQAILALCHHEDSYFHHECEACQFRAQAGIEHLRRAIADCIQSLANGGKS